MQIRIPYIPSPITSSTHAEVYGDVSIDEATLVLTVTLESYAGILPLVPGDVLAITGQHESGAIEAATLVAQRDCWFIEIYGRTPDALGPDANDDLTWAAAELAMDTMARELSDMVEIARPSTYAIQVATDDPTWLQAYLRGAAHVSSYAVLRQPGDVVDLEFHRRDLGTRRPPEFDTSGRRVA